MSTMITAEELSAMAEMVKSVTGQPMSADKNPIEYMQMMRDFLLEEIIAKMPGNVYWLDENGVYLGCNDNHAQVAGLNSCKEIVGKAHTDISSDQKVMHSGRIERVEEFVTLPNGKPRPYPPKLSMIWRHNPRICSSFTRRASKRSNI